MGGGGLNSSGSGQRQVSVSTEGDRHNVKHVSISGNSRQQSAESGHRSGARNSETAITVSSAITCYVRVSVIGGVMRFVATKRKTAKWVETRVSVCLSVCVLKF